MDQMTLRRLVPVALSAALFSTAAQSAPREAPADPLDAAAAVPQPPYTSAFAGYRRHGDAKPVAWKDANDTVSRIGGWRVYAREAAQPATAASQPASAAHSGPGGSPR